MDCFIVSNNNKEGIVVTMKPI